MSSEMLDSPSLACFLDSLAHAPLPLPAPQSWQKPGKDGDGCHSPVTHGSHSTCHRVIALVSEAAVLANFVDRASHAHCFH